MKRILSVIGGLFIVGIVGWAVLNVQLIRDSYTVYSFDLQPEAAQIKSQLLLTPNADFLYQASRPEVQSAEQFNRSCANVSHEHSIVLGCYTAQRFYIYDVNDERLAGVKEVTAAHELLHAVYERLSTKEREAIDKLLIDAASKITNQRFIDTMAQYEQTDPSQLSNELHSIIGTEIETIPEALETHYAQYFQDRQKIVLYALQYESTFTSLQSEIDKYDTQLADLKTQKEALEASLEQAQKTIINEQQRLEQLKSTNEIDAYNFAVPQFNALVRSYNADIVTLQQVVSDYNAIVEKRNGLATTQSDLVQELNSHYQSL